MDEDTKLLIKSYTAFWIVLTLILAAFFFVKAASPATAFIEIGQSKYEKPPCGLWHQECADYGVDWNMKPSMFRIGLDHDGWRISYAVFCFIKKPASKIHERGTGEQQPTAQHTS